ncbi:zf-C3HC4_3 domain-containing protein [Senna tora]|uniref:Zf-C3HC4_3 domain-containing protein n=1 Tax=Senna tora TaxID=362788 RepID=A0A834WNZ2_9FABA|nr:zf-C3HC4_3 domain-containing protein [Senna tora]
MHRALLLGPLTQSHRWPHSTTPSHSLRWQETLARRLLVPLTIWIFSVSLRYWYFGDSRLVLGPSSSHLMEASSVFVKEIEVTGDYNRETRVYAFNEKPELSVQANWSASDFLVVAAYSRRGFSLWLNKGSTIRVRLEAPSTTLNQIEGFVIKGETKFENLHSKQKNTISRETIYGKEAEYIIEEEDRYYIGVLNMNDRNIILTMDVNVSAMVYDISKAKNMCSTTKGSCRLRLLFPNTHYLTLMTTNNGDLKDWSIGISFVVRLVTFMALLGFIIAIICLILKYLGACNGQHHQNTSVITDTYQINNAVATQEATETEPILQVKTNRVTYGTNEEEDDDDDSGASSSSSEELYDEKLCIICYDEQRNCFFIPCGHCATCYDCAQRIMEGDIKGDIVDSEETLR